MEVEARVWGKQEFEAVSSNGTSHRTKANACGSDGNMAR